VSPATNFAVSFRETCAGRLETRAVDGAQLAWPVQRWNVDVVTPRATSHLPGGELKQAMGLDMAAWWKPTAKGYFRHVSKAAILEAVGVFAPSHVT
jgi:hypothetical protein